MNPKKELPWSLRVNPKPLNPKPEPRKLVFSEKPARKARRKTAERRGVESGPLK